MQPIILLGVAVAAVALVSTGFLAEPWNQFTLAVQELGWGEDMLNSPISHATVDLEVKKNLNPGVDGETGTSDDYFDNVISRCSFHSPQTIDGVPTGAQILNPGVIICKILDDRGLAIAEGKMTIPNGYEGSTTEYINIQQCILEDGTLVETTDGSAADCLDVQYPIHHVKLVVEAPLWNSP